MAGLCHLIPDEKSVSGENRYISGVIKPSGSEEEPHSDGRVV